MDRLAFTAAQGIAEKAVARQLMTNELANVSTVGFKRSYDVALQAIKVEGSGAICLRWRTSRLRRDVSSARSATSTSRSALNGFSMKS